MLLAILHDTGSLHSDANTGGKAPLAMHHVTGSLYSDAGEGYRA